MSTQIRKLTDPYISISHLGQHYKVTRSNLDKIVKLRQIVAITVFPKQRTRMGEVGQSLKTNRKTLSKNRSILFLKRSRKRIREILITLLEEN